jgi:segregation and condensation protein A
LEEADFLAEAGAFGLAFLDLDFAGMGVFVYLKNRTVDAVHGRNIPRPHQRTCQSFTFVREKGRHPGEPFPTLQTVLPEADLRIKLQVFEGPLDLLLFLIRKNEIDIYDIPIESVTKQYVAVLRSMQQLDLEVAGEFFVMAASLMEIKSRMLLPKGQHAVDPDADAEDGMDPRWELVHQLLQYKKFKDASQRLAEMARLQRDLMERQLSNRPTDALDRPLRGVSRIELWNTFNQILRRLAEKLVVGEIHDEVVTVADQMEWLLERMQSEKTFVFSSLFGTGVSLRRLVATFLAVLELTRLSRMRLRQNEAFTDIVCEATPDEKPLETNADAATVEL